MIVDGKKIALEIREELKDAFASLGRPLTLGFIRSGDDLVAKKFVDLKAKTARELGVHVVECELPADATTGSALRAVADIAAQSDAMLVQMPLAQHIEAASVLAAVPLEKDVDAMGERSGVLVFTPVVGAMREILLRADVSIAAKKIAVVGAGKLVGAPAAAWLATMGAEVRVVTSEQGNLAEAVADADIVVLGAGKEGLLKKEMIKEGAVVLDAGASESAGTIKGDADPACADVASVFTPVPGGIGPVAIAMIFKNLLFLAKNNPLQGGR